MAIIGALVLCVCIIWFADVEPEQKSVVKTKEEFVKTGLWLDIEEEIYKIARKAAYWDFKSHEETFKTVQDLGYKLYLKGVADNGDTRDSA